MEGIIRKSSRKFGFTLYKSNKVGMPKAYLTGFTLIEIMIDISVLALVATGVLSAYSASFKAMELAKAKTASVALANEKMEEIHNMSYDSLATEHGIIYPPGTIKDDEEFTRRGVKFNVHTIISYIDDPYDGNADGSIVGKPKDLYPYDYKKVEVVVSKIGRAGHLAQLTTNIAAKAAETPSNTGIIKLCVVDSAGTPVSGATLTVQNFEVDPAVDISGESGIDGCIMIPNLPPDSQNSYHLTATKDGYSTDITYPRTSQNPNEEYQDVDVIVQNVTNKTLVIDKLSTMEINFVDSSGNSLPNINFHLENSKEIYFNPTTFKYSENLTTDANGYLRLTGMEFSDYKITTGSGMIAAISPYQPVGLKADVNLSVQVVITNSPTQPIILSSDPLSGKKDDIVYVTILGNKFDSLIGVKLINQSGAEIVGSNVKVIGNNTIEVELDTHGVAIGLWDIVVTNPGGESTKQLNGIEIKNE
ncbi:MAG: hypothetical protein WC536_03120 [Patescibacteria group bacterium]